MFSFLLENHAYFCMTSIIFTAIKANYIINGYSKSTVFYICNKI